MKQLPSDLSCHGGKLDRYIQGNKHGTTNQKDLDLLNHQRDPMENKKTGGSSIHGSLCDGEVVKPVVGCKNYWPKNWKKEWGWKELQAYLGDGFKYGLYVQTPIWGNDPIWLLFLRWVETTNYSYPRSVLYHTFPPKFEFHVPFCRQDHPWFHGTRWWYHPWQWTRWRDNCRFDVFRAIWLVII